MTGGNTSKENFYQKPGWRFFTEVVTLALAIVASIIYWRQLNTMQKQLDAAYRPLISIENGDGISFLPAASSTVDGRPLSITLEYKLANSGRSPANVEIYGRIVKEGSCPVLESCAKTYCDRGTKDFNLKPRIWLVIPSSFMIYDVHYDGGISDSDEEHMPAPSVDPQNPRAQLSNIGCIVYRSTSGDHIFHTPFIAQLYLNDPAHIKIDHILEIGKAD